MKERAAGSGVASSQPVRGKILVETITHSPEETAAFGRELSAKLQPPSLVLLQGELGSGKTTLVKGIVAGLGAAQEEEVTSPSFTLVHEYGSGGRVFHVDLYRIEEARELTTLGLEDLRDQQATVLVEWGERLGSDPPTPCFRICMEHLGSDDRRIVVEFLEA